MTLLAASGCGADDKPTSTAAVTGSPTSQAPGTTTPAQVTTNTTVTTSATTGPLLPSATISRPANNGQVSYTEVVSGTATAIPPNHDVWLVIQPLASKLHPQPGPVASPPGGQWSRVAYFGRSPSEDANKQFLLMVVSTPLEGSGQFKQYLIDAPQRNFPGLDGLPDGTVTLASVTVTRR